MAVSDAPEVADEALQSAAEPGTFTSALARLEDVADTFSAALHALETITCPEKQVSGITRKRLALRAVEKLEKTQADASRLQEDLLQLQEQDNTQHTRMEEQLQEHQNQSQTLSKCRHQVMMLHDRLQEHELVIQEHEQAAEAATTREQEDAAYRLTLQRTIDSLNSDVMELQKRTQEAEASTEHMAKEHTNKLQEMNEATAQAQVACDKLDDAELRATQAGTSVDKAHQAVAKLSADNVVLLVKLRKAESRSSSLAQEVSVLRAAVDSQSGSWFDDIHANVERVTREGMQRADTLQMQMESQQGSHTHRLEEASAERDRLAAHLTTALDSCRQLEAELQQSRKEVKELKVDAKRKAGELSSTTASLDAAAAEVRVVGKEREQMKREWTEMFSAHDSLVSRINALEHQLAQSHTALQEDRASLSAARKQVELERSVNRKLLQSKADVEYRLMEALSQLPQPSQTSHGEHRYMHETSAASPLGSQSHVRDAGSLPFIRTSQGAAADLPTDSYVARGGLSSPISSATGSLPMHAFPTSDHSTPADSYRGMTMHTSMRASVDTGAVDRMHHSTGSVGAPGRGVHHTEHRSHSSHSHRRTSPLQHCHSPVEQSGTYLSERECALDAWQDTRSAVAACSPSGEDGSTRVFGQSNHTTSSQGHAPEALSRAPEPSSSTGAAGDHHRVDDFPSDILRCSSSTANQQGASVADKRSSPQGGSQGGSPMEQVWASGTLRVPAHVGTKGSVCSESDAGARNGFAACAAMQEQQSAASSPSHDKWQVAPGGVRSSQFGFGHEEQQENVLLHTNVVRHMPT